MMARPPDEAAELKELLERLREHQITPVEVQRLEAIVLNDSAAMDVYVRYMAVVAGLRGRLGRLSTLPQAEPAVDTKRTSRKDGRRATKYVVAVSLVALAGLIYLNATRDRAEPHIVSVTAGLDHVSGEVVIVSQTGQRRTGKRGISIASGDTIRVQGVRSLARLAFGDGTTILLAGEGVLTYTHQDSIHLMVLSGTLIASVTAQPRDKPMILATPSARIRVLGTEFSLSATHARTEVKVTKGSVELTRRQDGRSVVIAGGKRATADTSPDLAVQDNRPTSETWNEDFEEGLPSDWQVGKFVSDGLLSGSQGAVQAVRPPESQVYAITSAHAWVDGLFTVQSDSHLHMTFKMDQPDWFNIFFITRADDPKDPTTFLHKFDAVPVDSGQPGKWWTVTIPLAKFQRLTEQGFVQAPVQDGGLVFGISWTAPGQDRGLVVDRAWVTRGGPNKVVLRRAATTNRQVDDSK